MYNGFLKILADNKLKPDDLVDMPKGKFTPAKIDLEVYDKIPMIKDLPAYQGHKAKTSFKGGETNALAILDKYCQDE